MDEWAGRLRIGLFTNVYLPTTNGVVVSVESFRKALTHLGHHLYVFGPHSGDIEDRAPYIFRYPALELPLQKYPLALPLSPYVDHLFKNLKPQVLHANHPALLGRVAVKKSQEFGLPLVFTYHTRYVDYAHYADPLPQDRVKDFIEHWLAAFMTECHHVIVPSESIKSMICNLYEIKSGVSVVPTGVETERFSAWSREQARQKLGWADSDTVLISVGRLAKEKSFDVLIRALPHLENKQAKLVILGSGDESEALEELSMELGLAERVIFPGLVPFEDVPVYLAASDLFAFASVTETQGLVTLEAMAAGLPVVAVEASGTREAVDPDSSVLTEHNPESLAKGIDQLLNHPEQHQLREAARTRAGKFDIISQGKALIEVYETAIDSNRAGRRIQLESRKFDSKIDEFLRFFTR